MNALLRFITCGSVDDGKSTLIGRVLYETNSIFDDQLEALKKDSDKFGTLGKELDYALLVDGLAAEREQGITIDVAYRYFSTAKRSFIVADTPGHEQYTRNMATGASTAEVAILLVDAEKGLLPQTKRHSLIVSMVGVKHIILAVNKMDKIDYNQEKYEQIIKDYTVFSKDLNLSSIIPIPLAAKNGENIGSKSNKMSWYHGKTLIDLLETMEIAPEKQQDFLFPVQWVNRPTENFRGFAGTIAAGEIKVGDAISVAPLNTKNTIANIFSPKGEVLSAGSGEAVTLTMQHETDISRGSVISTKVLQAKNILTAKLLWMGGRSMNAGRYHIKLSSQETTAQLKTLHHTININDFTHNENAFALSLNDIGLVTLSLEKPLTTTNFSDTKELGSFILIDPLTFETVAMGMVEPAPLIKDTRTITQKFFTKLKPKGESHQRSLLKAITWRVTGSADTFILSYLFTSSIKAAAAISLAEVFTKIFLYYGHERIWNKISFGKTRAELAEENKDGAGI